MIGKIRLGRNLRQTEYSSAKLTIKIKIFKLKLMLLGLQLMKFVKNSKLPTLTGKLSNFKSKKLKNPLDLLTIRKEMNKLNNK
jgi:hypothetical protein